MINISEWPIPVWLRILKISNLFWVAILCIVLFFCIGYDNGVALPVTNSLLAKTPQSVWPPQGQQVKCTVMQDTWISSVAEEKNGSNGGAKNLKLKGQQEFVLIDFDFSLLKGKIITGALLHVCSASPRKAPLARVGVSSIAQKWVAGDSRRYRPQVGSSCFSQAGYGKRNWSYPGSTLMDVVFGRGHTIWKFAESSPPEEKGWQTCAVDADVVAARIAGLSHGFCLYDEVGSVWSLEKDCFEYKYFPNRFIYSKESGTRAPWMAVWINGNDSIPPGPIESIRIKTDHFPAGEALVVWDTPVDHGGGKTLGFHVTYKRNGRETPIPRYLIPMAEKPGEEVRMHIQDLPFKPGESIKLIIRPVDCVGNIGQPLIQSVQVSSNPCKIELPFADIKPFPPCEQLPQVGRLKVAVVDLLDKIDPKTGIMIPARQSGYKGGNHLYSAEKKLIRLQGARNETVCFQLNLEGHAQDVSLSFGFEKNPELKPKMYQFAYVNSANNNTKVSSMLPDPLVPLETDFSVPSLTGQTRITKQTNHSLICEIYIPHEESTGRKKGTLSISVGNERQELAVDLTVWDFTLPDKLSFVPEMNAYGTKPFYEDYSNYRLAHEHRTCINWLPYGWNGLPFFSPEFKDGDFVWSEWDKKVGPLLDGSAFDDLPRSGQPVDVFYLPFSENWPMNIYDHYTPSYWADEAFTDIYTENLKNAFAAFASHCNEMKWHNTIFQFYLNNKIYYRKHFKQCSAPWIFDEPINTQDFWSLRWYGIQWQQAVGPVMGNTKMWYRGDISYSQYARNMLWGILDISYVGDNNSQKVRMLQDEQSLFGPTYFFEYGTANKIDSPNTQPVHWCISAWARGAMGVLPWQTIGSKTCWKNAEQTAIFYPSPNGSRPSVRLKAFQRGQQDVEYLTLFSKTLTLPHYAVSASLAKRINLKGEVFKSALGDAGTATFVDSDAVELWHLRNSLGKTLSTHAPAFMPSLKDLQKRHMDIRNLPDIGYVTVSPEVDHCKPVCTRFRP